MSCAWSERGTKPHQNKLAEEFSSHYRGTVILPFTLLMFFIVMNGLFSTVRRRTFSSIAFFNHDN